MLKGVHFPFCCLFQCTCHDMHSCVYASMHDNHAGGCRIGVRAAVNDKARFVLDASKMYKNEPKTTELMTQSVAVRAEYGFNLHVLQSLKGSLQLPCPASCRNEGIPNSSIWSHFHLLKHAVRFVWTKPSSHDTITNSTTAEGSRKANKACSMTDVAMVPQCCLT